jgi:hypothetical protein
MRLPTPFAEPATFPRASGEVRRARYGPNSATAGRRGRAVIEAESLEADSELSGLESGLSGRPATPRTGSPEEADRPGRVGRGASERAVVRTRPFSVRVAFAEGRRRRPESPR